MATKDSVLKGGKGVQVKRRLLTRGMTAATNVASLPRGAVILGFVISGTASNAGTTAVIGIGSSSAASEFVTGQSVLAAGAGNGVNLLNGVAGAVGTMPAGGIPTTADTKIWFIYAETGTASTVGSWVVHILYTTGNDVNDDTV